MTKYVLAYHGGAIPETEEEMATVMAAWGEWMGGLGTALVDGGNPIGEARTITSSGTTDDAGSNPLSGYGIIEATDMDAAVALASGCPVIAGGGSVEVCETFEIM